MADGIVKSARGPQRRAPRKGGWTLEKRTAFLDHLAATCNVSLSVKAVGMTDKGVRELRKRDPVFAQLWTDALEAGYDVLKTELLREAIGGSIENPASVDATRASVPPGTGFNPDLALRILAQRDGAGARPRAGGRPVTKRVPIEEVEAVLTKRLDAIARRLTRIGKA